MNEQREHIVSSTTRLDKYQNRDYQIGAGRLKRGLWYLTNLIIFQTGLFPFYGMKRTLLRWFGARLGQGVIIKPGVNIKYPWKLAIGAYTWIGEKVWIDNLGFVEIGAQVCISQGAMLLCGNHNYSLSSFDLMVKGIILEDGVWIGARALVCPGVTCASHSVLAVLSVANRSLEAYSVYQGNPALFVKKRMITEVK